MQDNTSEIVKKWRHFYKLNNYYHKNLQEYMADLIPSDASVLEFGAREGEMLESLPNKDKLGVDYEDFVENRERGQKPQLVSYGDIHKISKKYDYILLSDTLAETQDIQKFIKKIKKFCHQDTRIVVVNFNYFWKPMLDLAELLGLHMPNLREPNWLSSGDIDNFFYLENYESIKHSSFSLLPYKVPLVSFVINRFFARLPVLSSLCINNIFVYKPLRKRREYSVSVIIPARNEAGNMKGVLSRIPKFGKKQEVIFVEGHSDDDTYKTIKSEIKNYKGSIKARLFKQKGKGKGDAVRLGFNKAENELLMILDADLTVDPKELPKFYEAAAEGKGDLIMGSRLIYRMEDEAMRTLNILGNKFFSIAFSFLLDQRIKDTLCGTKVLLKNDYERIRENRKIFGDFDPFGDYDLIFGAAKLNMKIIEIPIRYKERTYGTTNISRFRHGLLLLKMCLFAAKSIKFN